MANVPSRLDEIDLKGRGFILVNREELAKQTYDKVVKCNPKLKVGIEKAESRVADDTDVVIMSVQSCGTAVVDANGSYVHTDRIKRFNPDQFTYGLVDETHRASTNQFRSIIQYFGMHKQHSSYQRWKLLVGFTATPFRTDGQDLAEFYDGITANRDIIWGIENNWLVEPLS